MLCRRLSCEGELAVSGPTPVGVEPAWKSRSQERGLEQSGFGLAGDVAIYLEDKPLHGLWVKAHGGYE